MSKNKKISILLAIAVVILALYYFTKSPDVKNSIKVGAVLPMTGFGQLYGEETQKGFNLCKNDYLELIVEDSQSLPAGGVSAFSKLVSSSNPGMIILMMSSVAEATLPLIKNYDGVVLATGVSTPEITKRGGDKYFRYFSNGVNSSILDAKFLLNDLKIKKLGVLYHNSDYGKTYLNGADDVYKNAGEIISEGFNPGTTDFRTSLIKLIDKKVDGIYIVGYDQDLELSIKTLKNLTYGGKIYGNSIVNNLIQKDSDKNYLESVYFSSLGFITGDKSDKFFEDYKNKYGGTPNWYAATGCDIARQVNNIEDANFFGYFSKLKSFSGLNGDIENIDREMEIKYDVSQYINGTVKVLKENN